AAPGGPTERPSTPSIWRLALGCADTVRPGDEERPSLPPAGRALRRRGGLLAVRGGRLGLGRARPRAGALSVAARHPSRPSVHPWLDHHDHPGSAVPVPAG